MSEQDVQPAAAPEAIAPESSAVAPESSAIAPNPEPVAPNPEVIAPNPSDPALPDWFMKDKYKTIEDQAKAQYEMRKLIGPVWGPPKDDYKMEGIEGINPNDPVLNHLKPELKEMGLSQEGFERLINKYQTAQIEEAKSMESELKKTLTQKDAAAITEVDSWLKESFTQEDAETMRSWIVNEKDFHLLRTLKALIPGKSNVPSMMHSDAVQFESVKQIEQEKVKYLNEVKMGLRAEDKNHWERLNMRFRDAYTRENHSKKR